MYKHIELYVNKYSVSLGEEGRKAVKLLFDMALRKEQYRRLKKVYF